MMSFLKSLVAGLMAAGLFFFFAMMLAVPISGLLARAAPTARPDMVVDAGSVLRDFGVPVSAAVFLATFALVFRRLRTRPAPSAASESNLL